MDYDSIIWKVETKTAFPTAVTVYFLALTAYRLSL